MSTASLSGSWQFNDSWAFRGGLGVILDGTLQPETGSSQNVTPGGLLAIGLDYLAIIGEGYIPFVDVSLFLSGSATEIEDPVTRSKQKYNAADLRLGARASWSIKRKVFPYLSARLFGGPVNWELDGRDVVGTDIHHYQIAYGTAIQIRQVGIFVERAGIGEKAVSMGLSYAW